MKRQNGARRVDWPLPAGHLLHAQRDASPEETRRLGHAGQNFGDVAHLHGLAFPSHPPRHIHQATQVARQKQIRIGFDDIVGLAGHHLGVAEIIAGRPGEVNYDAIPSIIYTWPEVASVGLTEEQIKERDIPYCSGTYPFTGAGRARCMGETEGFVKNFRVPLRHQNGTVFNACMTIAPLTVVGEPLSSSLKLAVRRITPEFDAA